MLTRFRRFHDKSIFRYFESQFQKWVSVFRSDVYNANVCETARFNRLIRPPLFYVTYPFNRKLSVSIKI